MIDEPRVSKQLVIRRKRADIALVQHYLGTALVLCQVCGAPADQVVNDVDAKAPLDQQVHHMASDEAGAAGDDGQRTFRHQTALFFRILTLKYRSSVMLSGSLPSLKALQRSRTASSMVRFGLKPSLAAILSEVMRYERES